MGGGGDCKFTILVETHDNGIDTTTSNKYTDVGQWNNGRSMEGQFKDKTHLLSLMTT